MTPHVHRQRVPSNVIIASTSLQYAARQLSVQYYTMMNARLWNKTRGVGRSDGNGRFIHPHDL